MYPNILGIDAYFVLSAIGVIAGFFLGYLRRKKYGYEIRELVAMVCAIIAGLLIGGKVLFALTEIPAVVNSGFSWEVINRRIINGGLVFYGGLIGLLAAVWLLAKYIKADSRKMLNFIVPSVTLFHVFGRIGCLLQGCCYGKLSSCGFETLAGEGSTRIPVQLYEAIVLVVITAALLFIEYLGEKKGKKYPILIIYLLMYAPARFVLEIFRGDELRGVTKVTLAYSTTDGAFTIAFDLSTSQIISLAILLCIGLYGLYRYMLARGEKKAVCETEKDAEKAADGEEK